MQNNCHPLSYRRDGEKGRIVMNKYFAARLAGPDIYRNIGGNMEKKKSLHLMLPPQVKSWLKTLAALDSISETATLKRLIAREYMARRDEIKAFRQVVKDDKN